MIRFLDSSAIVSAYEVGRGRIGRDVLLSGRIAVSRLAEVETVSAFARTTREKSLTVTERDAAISVFLGDLGHWDVIELVPEVVAGARDLVIRHALKASDAIQLSSGLFFHSHVAGLNAFVSYDRRLAEAARQEGLTVIGD